jgi:hypothetical protein
MNIFNWKFLEPPILPIGNTYLDLVPFLSLVIFLSLTVYFSHRKNLSKRSIRWLFQILSVLIFGILFYNCMGPFAMIRDFIRCVRDIGRDNYYFFAEIHYPVVILFFTGLFSNTFCYWVCPTRFFQDIANKLSSLCGINRLHKISKFILLIGGVLFFIFIMIDIGIKNFVKLENAGVYWGFALIIICITVIFIPTTARYLKNIRWFSAVIILISAVLDIHTAGPFHFLFRGVLDYSSIILSGCIVFCAFFIPAVFCSSLCPFRCALNLIKKKK